MGQGLVSKDVIRQIKERADIADVVGGYVTLTRAGQNLKGLCPFHAEKTPSFMVNPSRQVFHCFGCGVGGDVFAFLMKRENMEFMETVRELGRRAGVDLSQITSRQSSDHERKRERIWKINDAAAEWFRKNLAHPTLGGPARQYLASRGIQAETTDTFGLGFAPTSWDGLIKALTREGWSLDDLVVAGLIVAKDDGARHRSEGGGYYDRFRGRLMFPILDQSRRVMAFGGRVIGDGLPKYLNSPELPIFKKGKALYALPQARDAAWHTHALIVVEGYFDAVALHQAGVRNVVATLGTALTADHVFTLGRLARKIVLIFDPDPAGVRAAVRTLDLFKESEVSVRVVSLPEGHDPDTFIRQEGQESFQQLQEKAPSLLEFAVRQSLVGARSGALDDRVQSVDEVLGVLHKTSNPIEREECLRVVAEELDISQALLIRRYPDLAGNPSRSQGRSPAGGFRQPARATERAEERDIVRLLLQDHLSASDIRHLRSEDFSGSELRCIVECALRHLDGSGRVLVERVLDEVVGDPQLGPVATGLSVSEAHYDDVDAYIRGCLDTLARRRWDARLSELIAQLRTAEREGRRQEAQQLNAQIHALRMEKKVDASRTA